MKYLFKKILFSIVILSLLLSCNNQYNFSNINNYLKLFSFNRNYLNLKNINIQAKTEEFGKEKEYIKKQYIRKDYVNKEYIKKGYNKLENELKEYIPKKYLSLEEYNIQYGKMEDFKDNIRWGNIVSKFAIGSSIIVITATLGVASSSINPTISFVFFCAFKGSIEGALVGATSGALSGLISETIEEVSLASIYDVDFNNIALGSLEYAADGFMWGAITGAVIGGKMGFKQYREIPKSKTITPNGINKKLRVKYSEEVYFKNGEKFRGLFPKFKHIFETKLPKELLKSSDEIQFKYALEQLKNNLLNKKSLKSKFTKQQIDAIFSSIDGRIPELTWHHHQKEGILQLVDRAIHMANPHTGGRSIWGGGGQYR